MGLGESASELGRDRYYAEKAATHVHALQDVLRHRQSDNASHILRLLRIRMKKDKRAFHALPEANADSKMAGQRVQARPGHDASGFCHVERQSRP